MDIISLLNSHRAALPCPGFETDGIGLTWGISYARFVTGERAKFQSIEHFFYCAVKSPQNMSSSIAGGLSWEERVDMEAWITGLTVKSATPESMLSQMKNALVEIANHLHHWTQENTLETSTIVVPKDFRHCYLVHETVQPRCYINTTQVYLGERDSLFYMLEEHWES